MRFPDTTGQPLTVDGVVGPITWETLFGVDGGRLTTIEGNTNDGGSREGVGVFRRSERKIASINKGFLDYGVRT